jgi:hypothetical protein
LWVLADWIPLSAADNTVYRGYMGSGSNFAKNYAGGVGGEDIRLWSKRIVTETRMEALVTKFKIPFRHVRKIR